MNWKINLSPFLWGRRSLFPPTSAVSAVIVLAFLALVPLQTSADVLISAVQYKCDIKQREITLTVIEAAGGLHGSPVKLYDGETEGVYDFNAFLKPRIDRKNAPTRHPIIKKCRIGNSPFSIVIEESCTTYNGSIPKIQIYRSNTVYIGEAGQVISVGAPFLNIPLFGGACGSATDKIFSYIKLKVVDVESERFQIEVH